MTRCHAFECYTNAIPASSFCTKHHWRLSQEERAELARARGIHLSEPDPLKREITLVQLNNVIGNCRDALRSCERRAG